MNALQRAKELARSEFAGRADKAGVDYFTGHLSAVAGLVTSDEEKTVAYLHDILEDTDYPEEKLREEFGDNIADAVCLLTHREKMDEQGYLDYIRRLKASGNAFAIAVKAADLTNNSDYTRLGASSPDSLPPKDRKRWEKYQKSLEILKGAANTGNETITYYNQNAIAYVDDTFSADCSEIQERFMAQLAPGAKVLDFGCGSGRDALVFLKNGFDVTAVDGSEEMCRIASGNTGLEIAHLYFQDLDFQEEFDGIWACASILHLSYDDLSGVLPKMAAALKHGGIIYASFKYGDFEGIRNGRYFCDFTEERFARLIHNIPDIVLEEQWRSQDVRPGREKEEWLNSIVRKR